MLILSIFLMNPITFNGAGIVFFWLGQIGTTNVNYIMKFFFLSLLLSSQTFAQLSSDFHSSKQPLFELGLGAINVNIPYYPGSKSNQNIFLPFMAYLSRENFSVRSRGK